jgi:anti-sigma B factor antagonist
MAVSCDEDLLAQQHDEHVVIALPKEIDVTNSFGLRETLAEAIGRHPAVVVADMSATTFCDSSGMGAIVGAYRQAIAVSTDMRLVIGHPAAHWVFETNSGCLSAGQRR